ncbi:MAG: hypothetical protein L0Z53_02935 [Acidobacteriales bacterium]|nr:hypothetical protein [Terriglobales bacterium]
MSVLASVLRFSAIALFLGLSVAAQGETCSDVRDMDGPTRSSMENAALQMFGALSRGDVAAMRQNAIPSLASNFTGVEAAINANKPAMAAGQASVRATYLLEAGGTATLERAEFLCGVWGTTEFVSFSIPNLPPGRYGVVIHDVKTTGAPYLVTFILQQDPPGVQWKLAGFPPPKQAAIQGRDAQWFFVKAREYKAKGQLRNAWFYYQQARSMVMPVDFISTMPVQKLEREAQQSLPPDLPVKGPVDLAAANGKSYKLTEVFPVVVDNNLDLVVKYSLPDVSDTAKTFQDNVAVIKAMVTKFPELRETFGGIVARAVAPSGQDYGTLLAMKDIK